MDMNEYQKRTLETRIYPEPYRLIYPTLGLNGEAGEVAELVKKILRGDYTLDNPKTLANLEGELGDVLYYLASIAQDAGLSLNDIAKFNLKKLALRKATGKLQGDGSNR